LHDVQTSRTREPPGDDMPQSSGHASELFATGR